MKAISVYGNSRVKVIVNPIDVLEEINIIPKDDWIVEKDGKYIQMTEEGSARNSVEKEVKPVSEEIYKLVQAKKLLIKYLKSV